MSTRTTETVPSGRRTGTKTTRAPLGAEAVKASRRARRTSASIGTGTPTTCPLASTTLTGRGPVALACATTSSSEAVSLTVASTVPRERDWTSAVFTAWSTALVRSSAANGTTNEMTTIAVTAAAVSARRRRMAGQSDAGSTSFTPTPRTVRR